MEQIQCGYNWIKPYNYGVGSTGPHLCRSAEGGQGHLDRAPPGDSEGAAARAGRRVHRNSSRCSLPYRRRFPPLTSKSEPARRPGLPARSESADEWIGARGALADRGARDTVTVPGAEARSRARTSLNSGPPILPHPRGTRRPGGMEGGRAGPERGQRVRERGGAAPSKRRR